MDDYTQKAAIYLEIVEALDPSAPEASPSASYENRNMAVIIAAGYAVAAGLEVGISVDPAEPTWPVLYIELPTGQVSWHLPQHKTPYDGHTTAQKYDRITRWVEDNRPRFRDQQLFNLGRGAMTGPGLLIEQATRAPDWRDCEGDDVHEPMKCVLREAEEHR